MGRLEDGCLGAGGHGGLTLGGEGRGRRGSRDVSRGGVGAERGREGRGAVLGAAGAGGAGRGGQGAAGQPGMASMAAAIAASRSVVMSGNRPLDDRERKRFTYFSSLSPMARKIMQDKEKIREKYGPEWARLPPAQQDEIIDRCLVGPGAPAPRGPGDPEELARFPGLRGPTGQKVVRFGDEVGAGWAGPGPSPLPVLEAPRSSGHLRARSLLSGLFRVGGGGWRGEDERRRCPGVKGRDGGFPGVWENSERRRSGSAGPHRIRRPPGAEGSCA